MTRFHRRREDVTTVEVFGATTPLAGLMYLKPYDPAWVEVFRVHEHRIRRALSDLVLVEHIGSTSVPGLSAKPIVDIVVGVEDITAEEDWLPSLLDAGYVLRVREPGHRLVRTPERDVHVHVYERDAGAVADYLLLRGRLRADADDRMLYESTKRQLLREEWATMDAYAEAKTAVIEAIKGRARAAGL